MRRCLVAIGVIAVCYAWAWTVGGRPVFVQTVRSLGEKSDVLAVGEVLEVEVAGRVEKEKTHWQTPLLLKRAKIQVLRCYAWGGGTDGLKPGVITLDFYALDWSALPGGIGNGPVFPEFSAGEVLLFPLVRQDDAKGGWGLMNEEDFNLIVPAVKQAPKGPAPASTVEFVEAELAGAWARGDAATLGRAARYVAGAGSGDENLAARLHPRIGGEVEDESRWASIAVAAYCAGPVERPTIRALLAEPPKERWAEMAALALRHVAADRRDERLMAEGIAQMGAGPWGVAVMFSINYADDPAAGRLLGEALDKGRAGAIYIAQYIIKSKEHPLADRAVKASAVIVRRTKDAEELRAACQIIRDYGSDEAFSGLLDELRRAQKSDRERYRGLWQGCAYAENPRVIAVCRILIEDEQELVPGRTAAELAAFELQRLTKEDFGLKMPQEPAEQRLGIERAREWARRNGK